MEENQERKVFTEQEVYLLNASLEEIRVIFEGEEDDGALIKSLEVWLSKNTKESIKNSKESDQSKTESEAQHPKVETYTKAGTKVNKKGDPLYTPKVKTYSRDPILELVDYYINYFFLESKKRNKSD